MAISNNVPIYYNIVCLLVGFGYAYFLYYNEGLIVSKLLKRFLFISRFFLVAFLAILLLNPIVKSYERIEHRPIVILAQDASSSISDSLGIKALNILANQLSNFQVYKFSFSDEVNSGFLTENKGISTNYSILLNELESRFEDQNVVALVLASDGLYNSGANPLYKEQSEFPVYTIAQGDTNLKPDVALVKVKQNDIAFLGNSFPLNITILAKECRGEDVKLSVWNRGKKVYSENIVSVSTDETHKLSLQLEADEIGLQKYVVQIVPLNNEENIENNTYTTYVDVIDSRYKILLLSDGFHPDIAAYKSTLAHHKNYTLITKDVVGFNEDFNAYQLVVLFGVSSADPLLVSLKNSNIPILSFDLQENNYAQLTHTLNFKKRKGLEEVRAVKNKEFSKFTFSNELEHLVAEAPPLYVPFGKFKLGISNQVVLNQKIGNHTAQPVIVLDEQQNRKIAFVTAEGFWRWKLYDYANTKKNIAFNELFSKLTQYLVLQEDKSKFRVNYKKQINESETIYFDAVLYNDSYELVNHKDITLTLTNEKGLHFTYEFSKMNKDYKLKLGVLATGHYTFVAKVKGTAMSKQGSFDVKVVQKEQLVTVANHQLLYQLSAQSGGDLFYVNEVNEILAAIQKQENNHNRIDLKEKLKGLIDIPWILLSLLVLIFMEWFFRKYNGLI